MLDDEPNDLLQKKCGKTSSSRMYEYIIKKESAEGYVTGSEFTCSTYCKGHSSEPLG